MGGSAPDTATWLTISGASSLDLLLRLLLAIVLGGAIGLERELSDKPAGFRTNILICLGAALFTEMSVLVATVGLVPAGAGDPTRIAAQIVSGMGFLGAGTILQARGSVRGLTTAATIWTVAAIGVAAGAGAYWLAIGATLLVILVLVILARVERLVLRRRSERLVQVVFGPDPGQLERLGELLGEAGYRSELLAVEKGEVGLVATLRATGPRSRWEEMIRLLLEYPGVTKVTPI